MELKKISLHSKTPVTITTPETVRTDVVRKKKIPAFVLTWSIVVVIIAVLLYAGNSVLSRFVTWNETDSKSESYNSIAVIITPPAKSYDSTPASEVTGSDPKNIQGKITVVFTKDKNQPFTDGVIRLKNSSGKLIKENDSGKTGTVIFDAVNPGSYSIEGARKGDSRVITKNATVGSGEFIAVSLSLQLDTPVTISVTVTLPDGSIAANKDFVLWRKRPTDGDEEIPVTTNEKGVFTANNIFPNQDWRLKSAGVEVATFSVAPSGQNQTINVKTISN